MAYHNSQGRLGQSISAQRSPRYSKGSMDSDYPIELLSGGQPELTSNHNELLRTIKSEMFLPSAIQPQSARVQLQEDYFPKSSRRTHGEGNRKLKSMTHFNPGKDGFGGTSKRANSAMRQERSEIFKSDDSSNFRSIKKNTIKSLIKVSKRISLFDYLTTNLRSFYKNYKDITDVFAELDNCNIQFQEIIGRVSCYRVELGNNLREIYANYETLIINFIQKNYKIIKDHAGMIGKKVEEKQKRIEEEMSSKVALEEQVRNLQKVLVAREAEIRALHEIENGLKEEIVELKGIINLDMNNINELYTKIQNDKKEEKNRKFISNLLKTVDKHSNGSDGLDSNLGDLRHLTQKIDEEQQSRTQILDTMNDLLKTMVRGNTRNQSTQVNEGELRYNFEILARDENIPTDVYYREIYKMVNMEEHLGGTSAEVERTVANTTNIQEYERTRTNKDGEENAVEFAKKEDASIIQSLDKNAAAAAAAIADVAFLSLDGSEGVFFDNWHLSVNILTFISNATQLGETGRVLPWLYFRRILLEIYDCRIKFLTEECGSPQNQIPADQFVCLWFLQQHQLRRLAEIKFFEFLTSLKFYSKIWARASIFAFFLRTSSSFIKTDKMATLKEDYGSFYCDEHMERFVLFVYTIMTAERKDVIHQDDGYTIIKPWREEAISKDIMIWYSDQEVKRWRQNLKRIIRNHFDEKMGRDIECYDFDLLFKMYLQEYILRRRKIQKQLTRNFGKQYRVQEGVLSFADFHALIKGVHPENIYADITFSGALTSLKAFYWALTSNKNSFEITCKSFIGACTKFGIDSPFPLVFEKLNFFDKIVAGKEVKNIKHQSKVNQASNSDKVNNPQLTFSSALTSKIKEVLNKPKTTNEKVEGPLKKKHQQLPIDPGFLSQTSASLFAQHFGILRELKTNVDKFSINVEERRDPDVCWDRLTLIRRILESGCLFLKHPVEMGKEGQATQQFDFEIFSKEDK